MVYNNKSYNNNYGKINIHLINNKYSDAKLHGNK